MENFNEVLKEEREITGLSQAEAARLLLVPYRTWQDWERATYTPPQYVQKALIYCINAIREDLLAAEIHSAMQSGLLKPDDKINIQRDGYDRIISWQDPNNKVSFYYQMDDDSEIESIDAILYDPKDRMTARDALHKLCLHSPYLTDEELSEIFLDD